jgi:SAM-dependent methyltransferase
MLKKIYKLFIRLSKFFSRKGIYPFLQTQYQNIPPNAQLLSIGAGGQVNLLLDKYTQTNNLRVTSFDIDPNRKPDILGDICTYEFDDTQRFDVVVMSEVLEHLHSPHLAIANVHKVLKPGGKLIITVPFIFPIHEKPYDYFRYTRYGLEFLLREFEAVTVRERDSWSEALAVLLTRHLMETSWASRLLGPLFTLLALLSWPLIVLLGRIAPTPFITTGYLVVANKVASDAQMLGS